MADLRGNFVNPAYATPEQLATQRAYAAELQKRAGEDVNRPTGALANMINALTSGLVRNNANDIQNQAAGQNAQDMSAMIAQLQGGQKVDPQNLGHIIANPLVSPEQRALALKLMTPEKTEDVAGRPAYTSPVQGVQATPIQGAYQPGYRAPESAGPGGVSTVTPFPAPMPNQRPPVPSSPKVWGDKEAVAAGLYPPQAPVQAGSPGGPQAPVVPPPGAAVAPAGSRIDQLASKARDLSFQQGGNETITNTQKEDISAAMNAPNIKRIAGTMLDDITKHGDKMTFGPTAEWSNNLKKVAANYAPGLMKDQIESLASADSFEKMSAQLTSMLSKGGGTDAQLFNNMKSVPGAHNSQEGAKALLLMVNQVADQQAALRNYVAPAKTAQEYEALRSQFFASHPIVNPITGNPIAMDMKSAGSSGGGGARIISVEHP